MGTTISMFKTISCLFQCLLLTYCAVLCFCFHTVVPDFKLGFFLHKMCNQAFLQTVVFKKKVEMFGFLKSKVGLHPYTKAAVGSTEKLKLLGFFFAM